MTPEAIARLREDVAGWHRRCVVVDTDDLRALLDAHMEALDALETFTKDVHGPGNYQHAHAVLAKAGRR